MQRRLQKQKKGTTLIETAFVLPVFLLVLMLIFEYGRFFMVLQVLDNAARDGARYAVVHTYDKTVDDIRQYVNEILGGPGNQLVGFSPSSDILVYKADPVTGANAGLWSDAAFGEPIAVEINGVYRPILPGFLFLPDSFAMQSRAVMRSEAN